MSKKIKEPLRQALFKVNKSQEWLAKEMGVHKMTVSRWANADELNTGVIKAIAKVFSYSMEEFLALGSVAGAGVACCGEDS